MPHPKWCIVQPKGEFENDRKISMGYDGTGSKGVLRGIRSNGESGSAGTESVSERGIYLPTDSVSVGNTIKQGGSLYTEEEQKSMQSRGVNTPAFYITSNDPVIFSQALETAKANNPNGFAVDSHSPEQMQEIIAVTAIPTVDKNYADDTLEMYPGRFTTNTETKLVNEVGTEETKKVLNEEIKNIDNFVEKISEKRSLEEARERYVNNEAFERELFPE